MRKLALSGFVLLVPESNSFARLTVATALSIGFLALLLLARPHRDHSTAAVAVVANLLPSIVGTLGCWCSLWQYLIEDNNLVVVMFWI